MKKRYDAAATARLFDAVREVERQSCAELVLELHARAGSYAVADARFGALLAFLSLVLLVFLPVPFPPTAILVDAVVFFLIGHFVSGRTESIRRLMTRPGHRDELVRTRAAALFYERGLANTAGETGLLLFVSLLERRVEILADRGLLARMPPEEWNRIVGEMRTMRSVGPDDVIAAIQRLGSVLAVCAPASAENPDELSSVPQLHLT